MERLDVHVVALDGDLERAVDALEDRFGMPRSAAERFFRTLPRVAKHQADPEEARAYRRVLGELGARVELRPAGSLIPPSSELLNGDLPSLPVPAHGPTGITHSMQTFASSARLADRVPRAPAVPLDLTGAFDDGFGTSDFDPDEVDLLMSSPFPADGGGKLGRIEFSGLSSMPTDDFVAGNVDSDPSTEPDEREAPAESAPRRRPSWAVLIACTVMAVFALFWALR